jgi:NADPH-dependent glutamate synthase beta subunit-like oxidoreductase/pyruvate/2-oxoacid:ferredoxin oxidoreductase beta subunit/Pyruvate/2-oxoacid:ferredoxin oxidoreductase delta subunit
MRWRARRLPVLPEQLLDGFDDVLSLYRQGIAETELPADELAARSLMPPASAMARDFASLAPTLPAFDASLCTGCMACVVVCPDAALHAVALPEETVTAAAGTFFDDDDAGAIAVLERFAETSKFGAQAERRGLAPARFGLFVDASKCKGCAECVEVCPQAALQMVTKVADAGDGRSTVEHSRRDMDFFRKLPPTPAEYRSGRELGDLLLGEDAFGYVGGAGSCAGCGEATAIRMMVAATCQVHGADSMGIVAATGCNSVYGATFPFNPYRVPWTNSLFENAPADALGIRSRWNQAGFDARKLWVLGGDGAMYDIGFQSLSRMVASGADINVLVLDTQAYSNTGGQASTSTFGGQVAKLAAFGSTQHGKVERRKELGRILMAHGDVYVAQVSTAHVNHFMSAVIAANEYPGPAVLVAYTPCMPENGIADDAGARSARAAVESRAFPLFTYDPRRGPTIAERLDLSGNPSVGDDWHRLPNGSVYDFLSFARLEGRFAQHFAADGSASAEIAATRDERLANWRTLQELAGIGRPSAEGGRVSGPLDFRETVATLTPEQAIAAAETCLQCKDATCRRGCPLNIRIPQYLEQVAAGDFAAAAAILSADNPLPCVTGRVCAQEVQCEGACKLVAMEGEPVPIGAIECFIGEWAKSNVTPTPPTVPALGGDRHAVIGSGPYGMAVARRLATDGHAVTVYEAYDSAGGVLRYGIPAYRLPKATVDDEIAALERLGVEFRCGVRVGEDASLDDLRAEYDAVHLGIGVGQSVRAGIPGEDLAGVLDANAFLELVNRGAFTETTGLGELGRVAVLGAGNTAIDAARSALRLGASSVTVVYRRRRAEVPAAASEVREAEAEGVKFAYLAAPLELVGVDGRLSALRCQRMALGEPDATGRPRPMPTGETFELEVEHVIEALGSRSDPQLPGWLRGVAIDDAGRVLVDDDGRTSLPSVFAGGDIVRGAATVVEAAADGLRVEALRSR